MGRGGVSRTLLAPAIMWWCNGIGGMGMGMGAGICGTIMEPGSAGSSPGALSGLSCTQGGTNVGYP